MFGSRCVTWLAALCVVSGSLVPSLAAAAKPPVPLQLPAGARVGVLNLLDPDVTHFHAARQIENSFLKTYTMDWSVDGMLLAAVQDRLTQLGLTPVPIGPGDELRRAREQCFLDAALAKGLPKECASLYTRLAASERLNAIIVLGPGRNDATHAGGSRHKELPEYLRGWCFVTGEGGADTVPRLLNLSELLLIGITPSGAQLVDREWGGNGQAWDAYRAPPDLKAFPGPLLDQLQPLFAGMLRQEASAALGHLQVSH
jgi:hypothetical protein